MRKDKMLRDLARETAYKHGTVIRKLPVEKGTLRRSYCLVCNKVVLLDHFHFTKGG